MLPGEQRTQRTGDVRRARLRSGLDVAGAQLQPVQPQVLPVEAEVQLAPYGEERSATRRLGPFDGRAERVGEGVVRHHLQRVGPLLGVAQSAPDPDVRTGQGHLRRVEPHQPPGRGMLTVVLRMVHAALELGRLIRVEQHFHRARGGAGEHVGVERGGHQIVLDRGQSRGHLAVREIVGPPDRGQIDAVGTRSEVGGGAPDQEGGSGSARHGALRCQGHDGRPQRLGPSADGRLVGVAEAHVHGQSEGQGDQEDQGDGGTGSVAQAPGRQAPYGGGVVLHALLGGEFLQPGSAHERLVEDE